MQVFRILALAILAYRAASFVLKLNRQSKCHAGIVCCKQSLNHHEDEDAEWHKFCDDIDGTMEGLVSPAPESFNVLHSCICRINNQTHRQNCTEEGTIYINDLNALSSYLVKPNYAVELFTDSDVFKWRITRRVASSLIRHSDFILGQDELYHKYNALELSRIALTVATNASLEYDRSAQIHEIARQAEKRLILTMGSDLRGSMSSDACFNFALAGVKEMHGLFQHLTCIGIHELQRTGFRSSFRPKHVLHMVEKFAASDVQGESASKLYHIAGECLEKKGYNDAFLIDQIKFGRFGFSSQRPLVWLWRFSSRQRKEVSSSSMKYEDIDWKEIFTDPTKPLVVDVGSGMGASILNLATLDKTAGSKRDTFGSDGTLSIPWSDCNYAGTELNQALVTFGNGIVSRDRTSKRKGRVHFFCSPAEEFLSQLRQYPGDVALVMINFPSPYRLQASVDGNSQLPTIESGQFMVTKKVLQSVSSLLPKNDDVRAYFLFQTNCEDVAVHVQNECLELNTFECIKFKKPVHDIDSQYNQVGKRPKRASEWLKMNPYAKRAEGDFFSATMVLPLAGRPETETQCQLDRTIVHRCLFG